MWWMRRASGTRIDGKLWRGWFDEEATADRRRVVMVLYDDERRCRVLDVWHRISATRREISCHETFNRSTMTTTTTTTKAACVAVGDANSRPPRRRSAWRRADYRLRVPRPVRRRGRPTASVTSSLSWPVITDQRCLYEASPLLMLLRQPSGGFALRRRVRSAVH